MQGAVQPWSAAQGENPLGSFGNNEGKLGSGDMDKEQCGELLVWGYLAPGCC